MKLLNRKSRTQQILETITDSLDLPGGRSRFDVSRIGHGNPLPDGLSPSKAVKAGLIAGGAAGLTAVSAGISSLRRAGESSDDS